MKTAAAVAYSEEPDHQDCIPIVAVVAMLVPVVVAFSLLIVFVVAEATGARPFAVAPSANVSEAAAFGNAGEVLGFISSGQDPNQRWFIRPNLLDAGAMHLTAVQAAILARRAEVVSLLLRRGARAESPAALACLAQVVGRGTELPPDVFGITATDYYEGPRFYEGPRLSGREALTRCGLLFD
jgi:hypothetical protein